MIVLVAGGVKSNNKELIHNILSSLPITKLLIVGSGPAHKVYFNWALQNQIKTLIYTSQWTIHGKLAPQKRDLKALKEDIDMILVFPGSKDSSHLVKISKKMSIKLVRVNFKKPNRI